MQCGLGHHMDLFGFKLVCCRATCKVKMIFLSPEVYAGAKLHNMVRCSENTALK